MIDIGISPHEESGGYEIRLLTFQGADEGAASGSNDPVGRPPQGWNVNSPRYSVSGEPNRRRGGLVSLLEKLKNLVATSAEKGDTAIDKAGDFFDKTQAKTDNAIDKVQEAAKKAVDKGSPNT